MEREKISRKRRGIAVLTLAALFFWYLPQIQVSRQIRKEQEEAVEMYVREEKEENKEENEKSEEVQEQEPGSTDQNLFRTIDFAGLRSKNREICAWLWIPGCALDVPVAHGQDNGYYLTHDAFCRERIYGSIFAPCDTPEDFSERHTILYGHNMRDGTMFGGLKSIVRRRGNRNFRICTCICRVKHGSAVFGVWRRRMPKVMFTGWEHGAMRTGMHGTGKKRKQHYLWQR